MPALLTLALLTPALIGVRPNFESGVIRAGVKGAGVKKGPAEKGPIRYVKYNLNHGPSHIGIRFQVCDVLATFKINVLSYCLLRLSGQ